MKKICIIFLTVIIISITAVFGFCGCSRVQKPSSEYLRIHIRAHSNEQSAQDVKYLVRDRIVEFLTPLVAGYQSQTQAMQGVQANLSAIERVADGVLQNSGFAYRARAEIKKESFPTRVYGDYTLPSGEYYALIIRLGEGVGDNWWCVVYPPLCFAGTSGQNVIYKSKIMEIINRWKTGK